jgi:uncharacterized membrane protein
VHTIAVVPTLQNVLALGIVVFRTFLSYSLPVGIDRCRGGATERPPRSSRAIK